MLPPLSRIRIRDGLSWPKGTAFTTPRTQWARDTGHPFGHETEGAYLIMVGPRLFDGDVALMDPATLVHEMTHVWQYKHGTLTEGHALVAHVHYSASDRLGTRRYEDLYAYEIGESWNDMGFEGQAQLVEEWYTSDKMSEKSDRWVYVKNVLFLEDRSARSLTLGELRLRDPDLPAEPFEGVRQVSFEEFPFSDDYLLRVLEQAIRPDDVPRLAARVKTLEHYFRQFRRLRLRDADALAARLDARKPGDRLAQAFHYHLSTPTRDGLIKVLRGLA